MDWLHILLMLAGGALALSGIIVAKKPDAKALLDKLVPFQAFIGVGLLAIGLIRLIQIGPIDMFRILKPAPVFGITMIAATFGAMLLGFLFGMPQIAKWIPGDSPAEQKGQQIAAKLAPFQVIIGVIVLGAGVMMLLIQLGLIKYL